MTVVPFERPLPPRGIRANNPGNLRKTATEWLGEVEGFDPDFETFDTPEHGVRALAKVLLTYQRKYHIHTIGGIVSKFAPPHENDTLAYRDFLCAGMGRAADDVIDLENHLTLLSLVTLIVRFENGRRPDKSDWYPQHEPDGTPGVISRGVDMALEA